jgi:hypothetical protein
MLPIVGGPPPLKSFVVRDIGVGHQKILMGDVTEWIEAPDYSMSDYQALGGRYSSCQSASARGSPVASDQDGLV